MPPPSLGTEYLYYLEFFCMGDLPILSCLFIWSFIYVSPDLGIGIVYSVIIQYCFIYFVAQIIPALAMRSS